MRTTWRFIDSGDCHAAYNMALDEAIARMVRKGCSPPTLRLYGWEQPSVTIGCFQKICNIDRDYCIDNGIPVVRRPTGGRAILHGHEVTYSFSSTTRSGIFSRGLYDSYRKISFALGHALAQVGIEHEINYARDTDPAARGAAAGKNPLCFQSTSYGEITVLKRKVIGSAQKRWQDALLQQGSIPFSIDTESITRVFRKKNGSHAGESTDKGLTAAAPGLTTSKMKHALHIAFEKTFSVMLIPCMPSEEERAFAAALEADKYRSEVWSSKI